MQERVMTRTPDDIQGRHRFKLLTTRSFGDNLYGSRVRTGDPLEALRLTLFRIYLWATVMQYGYVRSNLWFRSATSLFHHLQPNCQDIRCNLNGMKLCAPSVAYLPKLKTSRRHCQDCGSATAGLCQVFLGSHKAAETVRPLKAGTLNFRLRLPSALKFGESRHWLLYEMLI
jgi:hypothetical protein